MFFYYNLVIKPFLFYKLYLSSLIVPKIMEVSIGINNKNIKANSLELIQGLFILEYLSKKIPITKYYTQYEKKLRFTSCVSSTYLNKNESYYFLSYFINKLQPYFEKKEINIIQNGINLQGNYTFILKDNSILSFLPFNFYDWTSKLYFTFKFNGEIIYYKYLFNAYNFII